MIIIDNNNGNKPNVVKVTFNTNLGYIIFWTCTGSMFEARSRLKKQEPNIIWVDVYHARSEVGA